MSERSCAGPEAEEGSGGAGRDTGRDQPEYRRERPGWREPQGGQKEPGRGMQQRWEAQWQQFLHSAWGSPPVPDPTPWDDAKAFLASFEQVAEACRWPRGEWVARLMPALSGEAQQAFSLLEARDKEDYGKVKAAILRDGALRREAQRQHFRQFCCQELEDPRKMYVQIQALCCQWLKPERHTKEEILELLVLEQFLASLPVEAQSWIRAGGPDSCAQAVALLEDFLMSRREAETGTWQQVVNPRKVGLPLHMVEWIPVQSSQQTKFWKVLQEDGESVDSLDDGKGNQLKVKNTQVGGNEPVETPRSGQGKTHENVLVRAETMDERCESISRKGIEPHMGCKESGEITDSLGAACSNPCPVDAEGGKALFSKYGRRYCPKFDKYHSTQMEVKNYDCQESEVRFPSNTLAKHQLIHAGEKIHKCTDCGKMSTQRSTLLRHHNIHTGEKPHECPICEKRFSCRSHLLTHMMIHTREKPHKCPECGKNFFHRSRLLRHEIIHTGEKPHQCLECGKSFSQRSHLLRHEMIHTGKKPYKCLECGKYFSSRSHLLRHEMIHTRKKPDQHPE
ncbi:zinc finger and SCAN domain-containing protein 31-like [Tiliqua scincoides]|uniref:zinc finger and SCAN domain-containing protein 31-like n=1 Tax=Tiliqua scincoides TaxID=71010 RepID=UPI003461C312